MLWIALMAGCLGIIFLIWRSRHDLLIERIGEPALIGH